MAAGVGPPGRLRQRRLAGQPVPRAAHRSRVGPPVVGRVRRHHRGRGDRSLPPLGRCHQGGVRAPPQYRERQHPDRRRPDQPDALRRGAGRSGPSRVGHQPDPPPRCRLRRLPDPAREKGRSRAWPTRRPPRVLPIGTRDVLWPESTRWEALLARFADSGRAGPATAWPTPRSSRTSKVFRRGIGDDSDIVGKEMYEFEDRGGRTLALRPEGTASLVRAWVQHRPPLPWKAWYATPVFRYERPQAGGYRQHHQVGVEALGTGRRRPRRRGDRPGRPASTGPSASPPFGLRDQLDGRRRRAGPPTSTSCAGYLAGPSGRAVPRAPGAAWTPTRCGCSTASATPAGPPPPARPTLADHLCDAVPRATSPGCWPGSTPWVSPTRCDHRLVRGFDYYTRTTFEFSSDALESAQNGIGGGGRYDGLVEMLGGPPTPGIGFGMGIERILLACDAEGVFAGGPHAARRLRGRHHRGHGRPGPDRRPARRRALGRPGVRRPVDEGPVQGGRPLRGPAGSLIVGPDEAASGTVSLRPLRGAGDQRTVPRRRRGRTPCGRPPAAGDRPGRPVTGDRHDAPGPSDRGRPERTQL